MLRSLAALERLDHDARDVRSRAEELVSRPPYVDAEPGWFSRALTWIGEQLATVLQAFVDALAATGRGGAWAIVAVGLVVVGLVVWRLVRGSTLDRTSPVVVGTAGARSAGSWAEQARQHELDGHPRDAVRCWYAALVTALIERGVIEPVPGRTVRELDTEVARNVPERAARIHAAGAVFERVIYGDAPADPGDVQDLRGAVEAELRVRA